MNGWKFQTPNRVLSVQLSGFGKTDKSDRSTQHGQLQFVFGFTNKRCQTLSAEVPEVSRGGMLSGEQGSLMTSWKSDDTPGVRQNEAWGMSRVHWWLGKFGADSIVT